MGISRLWLFVSVGALCIPQICHGWSRGFVVTAFEPAMYYGGPTNGGANDPGPDCANGFNNADWSKELVTAYRSPEEVRVLQDPETGRRPLLTTHGFRGPNKEWIYENPTLLPDANFILSTSKIAEGFDLDGDASTGFVSPEGQLGVDNNFYRVAACTTRFRSPAWNSTKSKNDIMRSGGFTIIAVLSGSKSPMNDDDAALAFYPSDDDIVKDANGEIAPDYTFRISPDLAEQGIARVRIRDGVVEIIDPDAVLRMHDMDVRPGATPLELHKARARLVLHQDGRLSGLIGGYRPWFDQFKNFYASGLDTFQGGASERLSEFTAPAFYRALRQHADGLPDAHGRMTGISSTYRFEMDPVFVTAPSGPLVEAAAIFGD